MTKRFDPQKGESKSRAAHARTKRWLGSQTLVRGLEVLEAVASGVNNLADLAAAVKLNRSTAHRLASTLVEKRYLTFAARQGYGLGPKALEIGYQARIQLTIPRVAHEHLEALAAQTGDTVHLGILDGNRALYLDKIAGRRRIDISSRVGEVQPLRSTGLGKALLLDENDAKLREFYRCENGTGELYDVPEASWLKRMQALIPDVRRAADLISRELGWQAAGAAARKSGRQLS